MKNDRLYNIKKYLNENLKLIKLEFKGIKSNKTLIDISDLLKEYGRSDLIPEVEKFYLFDFKRIKSEIMSRNIRDEDKKMNIKKVSELEQIYLNYCNFLKYMKNIEKEIKDKYVLDRFEGMSLIYKKDFINIKNIANKLEQKRKSIDIKKLLKVVEYCSECLGTTIVIELHQRNVKEETELIRKSINDKISKISDINKYINRVSIKYEVILDISDEILESSSLSNKIKKKLPMELKSMIEEYNNYVNNSKKLMY